MSILELVPLGFPWTGLDPFIFTVHHVDAYPAGNADQGPARDLLAGRRIGADFSSRDGWSMYHGDVVPGFPQHPHRGFETVTVVRRGYVDHSDSLGATARYGGGDVQWLTTGSGIMHAEMFPLIHQDRDNPLELFQIWLNLPPESKMVPAYFSMLWSEDIPTIHPASGTSVDVMAGSIGDAAPPSPPPDSWGSQEHSELGIWLIRQEPGSTWALPSSSPDINRMLHVFDGAAVNIDGTTVERNVGARLQADASTVITNHTDVPVDMLVLQGRPIGAPVFQLGPFVMNSAEELQQAVDDYRRTQFGGWPWSSPSPVHARIDGRFALHADGRVEHRERVGSP
jgi:redox-sensitive bicupin YhaK (pirin superfamily)